MVTCRSTRKNFGKWFLLCELRVNHIMTHMCISIGFYIDQSWYKVHQDKSDHRSNESDKYPLKSFFPWKLETACLGAKFESWQNIETRRVQKKWYMVRNSYDWYYKIPKVSPVTDGWVSPKTCSAEEKSKKAGVGVSHKPDALKWAWESCVDYRWRVVGWSVVVSIMVVCLGLLGVVGQLLLQVASSKQYQHQISCSTRTFHWGDGKEWGHPCVSTRISWQVLGLPIMRELGWSILCSFMAQVE